MSREVESHLMHPLDILCEDGPLLAVNKPAGIPTQGVPATVPSLEALVKDYLKQKYGKPGNVYLGIPHRLDRPVSGVVIFARNSKAAARLAEQFRLRQVRKFYLAVVEGRPDPPEGTLSDWLLKEPDLAHMNVVPEGTPGAKLATLRYRVLETLLKPGLSSSRASSLHEESPADQSLSRALSLVQIELETGRMHQIRVQFASRGCPIVGDRRYGSRSAFSDGESPEDDSSAIALHAARLDLKHPIRYDALSLLAPLPESWQTYGFDVVDVAAIH